jgi:hypothetical protein
MPTYNLGQVKPHVRAAAEDLGPRFGIKTIGGYRAGQFIYGSRDHPGGLALDLMTTNGTALAEYARANADRYGISYVIWNRRIWSKARASQGWRPYSGDSPHTDHVHLSFFKDAPAKGGGSSGITLPGGGLGGGGLQVPDVGKWVPGGDLTAGVGRAADALQSMASGVTAIGGLAEKLMWFALPSSRVRIAAGLLGVVLLFFGIRTLTR